LFVVYSDTLEEGHYDDVTSINDTSGTGDLEHIRGALDRHTNRAL